jgi:hypothetical protein
MNNLSIRSLVLVIALLVSACGTQATPVPTLDPIALQGTAAVVAFTMIAETQAAIPTATPIPPTATSTNTPPPTDTPLSGPASQATLTPVANNNAGGGDPCANRVLPASLKGTPVKIRIDNSTKSTLALSVYLQQNGPQGECGYRAYTLAPGESIVINDLVVGCYSLWAWNPVPEDYFIVTNGTSCLDSSDTWAFDISTGSIRLRT